MLCFRTLRSYPTGICFSFLIVLTAGLFFSLSPSHRRGAEIPDVPLSELLFRSLVHFLQTGLFVDCRLVAQSFSYAEGRALNALQQQASAEDLVFDYGEWSLVSSVVG